MKIKVNFQDETMIIRGPQDVSFKQLRDKFKGRLKIHSHDFGGWRASEIGRSASRQGSVAPSLLRQQLACSACKISGFGQQRRSQTYLYMTICTLHIAYRRQVRFATLDGGHKYHRDGMGYELGMEEMGS